MYSLTTQNETKCYKRMHLEALGGVKTLHISVKNKIQIEKKKLDIFHLDSMGWIKTKNHLMLLYL